MSQGKVELTVDKGVGIVSFFHPKSNSLPGEILRKLADTISKAAEGVASINFLEPPKTKNVILIIWESV